MSKIEKLPFWKKVMYALGQFGWSLAGFGVGTALVYFYLPPEGVHLGPFIYPGYVLGALTIIGLVFATGRLFDAITDPIVAGLSDRCKFKFGRRRSFLAISVFPFAVFSFLVFLPPVKGISVINTVWLFVTVYFFYWFMTMYVTPFFAWLSELGHSSDERLQLSTLISITWALGAMVGSQIYTVQSVFEKYLDPATAEKIDAARKIVEVAAADSTALAQAKAVFSSISYTSDTSTLAFQITIGIFAVVAFLLMLLPVIFIDESRYCEHHVLDEGIFSALKAAFSNRNFLIFTFSDLAYWVSITMINTALVYYVTVLLKMDKGFTSSLIAVMFLLSFAFYIPVNIIAKKFGKKPVLMIAFVWFIAVFLYSGFLGKFSFSVTLQAYLLVIMAAIPLAVFGIVQNAIVADIAEADGILTGTFKAGIFFGARTFMSKMGQTVAGLLVPSLILLGAVPGGNDIGVRLIGIVSMVFCLIGFILFIKYDEKGVLKVLATKENLSEAELKEIGER